MARKKKSSNGCAFIYVRDKGYQSYTDGFWHSDWPNMTWDEFVVHVREILTKRDAQALTKSTTFGIICEEGGSWETIEPFPETRKKK